MLSRHYLCFCQITLEAIKSEKEEVALQGIEFWSTVCDEEADLAIEAMEAAESGRPPDQTSRFYVKGAMQYLVPLLMETLTKQVRPVMGVVSVELQLGSVNVLGGDMF